MVEGLCCVLWVHSLLYLAQSFGITGLEAGVDAGDAGGGDALPLRAVLLHEELGRAVHGDPLELREPMPGGVADRHQFLRGQRRRVAVGEEDRAHTRSIGIARQIEILDDLVERPLAEAHTATSRRTRNGYGDSRWSPG